MQELTRLVVRAGILDDTQLAEFRRWGLLDDNTPAKIEPKTAEQFVTEVEKALEDRDMILVRETDLEAVQFFIQNNREGSLHLEVADPAINTDVPVRYSTNLLGEYIFPWMGENMLTVLVNGLSYMSTPEGKVFFCDARELFYGEIKAFIVCKPSPIQEKSLEGPREEPANGSDKADNGTA